MSRKLFIALPFALAALTVSAQAAAATTPVPVIIAKWSLDSNLLAIGADGQTVQSTVSLVGGTTATFAAGAGSASTDKAYNTTKYPAASGANQSAGIAFAASTAGYKSLSISWDDKRSNTAANSEVFQYSTDGVNFTTFGSVIKTASTSFIHHSVDLSGITGINNDASFAFRILAAYDTTGSYVGTVGNYGTGGTIRFDNVSISGVSAVPEPESYAMLLAGLGLMGALARRKAKQA